jgi:hypothetical protein
MIGCPRRCCMCSSPRFRRSRRTWFRTLLKLLCIQPFRCDSCGHRVWRFNPFGSTPELDTPRPRHAQVLGVE